MDGEDAAFKDFYRAAKYRFRKALKEAKKDYKQKLENKLNSGNSRELRQGFQSMINYKAKHSSLDFDPNLPDKLTNFYGRFEKSLTLVMTPSLMLPPFL